MSRPTGTDETRTFQLHNAHRPQDYDHFSPYFLLKIITTATARDKYFRVKKSLHPEGRGSPWRKHFIL